MKQLVLLKLTGALALLASAYVCPAVTVTPKEFDRAHRWSGIAFEGVQTSEAANQAPRARERPVYSAESPFSFVYDGKPSSELLKAWKLERSSRRLDEQREERTLTWTDAATGFQVRCVRVEYSDFPIVEWTLYFKTTGTNDTPILENILALDTRFERNDKGDFLLHHAVGSPSDGSDYSPLETPLARNATKRITAKGGRPTNSDMSYFNLEWSGQGVIVVVGWPGQWAAEFVRDGGKGVQIRAGQELTHFKLLPGEVVRTPLIVLQFWQGDYLRSQNIWRRWMIAHNLPRPGGKLPPPQLVSSSARATDEMVGANEANQLMHVDRWAEEKFQLDYWWMDAGWYPNKGSWPNVGTWEVDTNRFPRGLRAISDHARAKGMKTVVWFEPERVTPGTWIYDNHPEWLLGSGKTRLLNLGNPDARKWLTDHVDKLITEQGIGLYRQDFNMDPLVFWRAADAPDRQGITEIKHVTGYLAYWDELRRRHPDMLIDSCASGGRRNDLETMRRSVPLWRSDHPYVPESQQSMTIGISMWIPYHGTATVACSNAGYYGSGLTPVEPYMFWANTAPSLGLPIDIRERKMDYDALRHLVAQWRQVSKYYYGDFYPLISCNRLKDSWAAWQFDCPEIGEGFIQVFRRGESPYESARLRLRGVEPRATYTITNLDTQKSEQISGSTILEKGIAIALKAQPGYAIMVYRKSSPQK